MNNEALDKIKKLLAHEKSARNIGSLSEAEAFASKIQEMLLTHKLSLSEIELDAEEHNEPITQEYVHPADTTHLYRDKSQVKMSPLASVIARAFFCRVILSGRSIIFVGRASNREAAIQLYKLLVNIAVGAFSAELKEYKKSFDYSITPGSPKQREIAFKNGYFLGFTRTIQLRFNTQQKKTLEASVGTGLVLVNKMQADVEKHMTELKLRSSKSRSLRLDSAGLAAGDRRASNVSLTSKALI